MKILSVAYDNNSDFILEIVYKFDKVCIVETFNNNKRLEQKSVRGIQNLLATNSLPLIAIKDENLELVGGIWPENNPDWENELIKKLEEL